MRFQVSEPFLWRQILLLLCLCSAVDVGDDDLFRSFMQQSVSLVLNGSGFLSKPITGRSSSSATFASCCQSITVRKWPPFCSDRTGLIMTTCILS